MTPLLWLSPVLYAAPAVSTAPAPPVEISSETLRDPYQLVGGTAAPSSSSAAVPFYPEFLEYEVKWGIFTVGTANLQVIEVVDFNGSPAYHIVSEAKSNGFCDNFYKVRDLNESWLDAKELRSIGYSKKLREGKFFRDEWAVYDYAKKVFLSKTTNRDGASSYAGGAIPGPVQDILSSMYFLRQRALKVGDEVIVDVNTKQNWPLVIKVIAKKRLEVGAGKFDTLLVEPAIRQEGIFIQKGKRLRVWLTDDARKIPVAMAVEVFFGNVTATLIKVK